MENNFEEFVKKNILDISPHPSQELIEDLESSNLTENSLQQKEEVYKKKKENVLKYLRENRINGTLNVSYDNFDFDISPILQSECKDMLKLIDKEIRESDRKCVRFAHYSGKMINHQKNFLKKESFKLFRKEIGYSDGWISFLLYVYNLVEQYPGVQQLAVSLKYLRTNKKIVNVILEWSKLR